MDEQQALQRLQDILAQPAFQTSACTNLLDVLANLLRPFLERALAWLLGTLGNAAAGREGPIGLVLLAASIVAVLAIVVVVAFAVRQALTRDDEIAEKQAAARRLRAAELDAEAQRLAAAGAYEAAIQALYLAALYALDERAVLRIQAGLTNREHAGRLSRERPGIGERFGSVVSEYDRLRYSGRGAGADSYHALRVLVEQVRGAA